MNTTEITTSLIDLSQLTDEAKLTLLKQLRDELEPKVTPKDAEILEVVAKVREIAKLKKCRVSVVAFTLLTALRMRAKIGEGVAEAIDTGTGEILPIADDKRSTPKVEAPTKKK